MKKRLSVMLVMAVALMLVGCESPKNDISSSSAEQGSSVAQSKSTLPASSEPVKSEPKSVVQSKSVAPVSSSAPIVSKPLKEKIESKAAAPSSKPSITGETTKTQPRKETPAPAAPTAPPVITPPPAPVAEPPAPPVITPPVEPAPAPEPQCQHKNGTVCPVCGLDLTGYIDMSGPSGGHEIGDLS